MWRDVVVFVLEFESLFIEKTATVVIESAVASSSNLSRFPLSHTQQKPNLYFTTTAANQEKNKHTQTLLSHKIK